MQGHHTHSPENFCKLLGRNWAFWSIAGLSLKSVGLSFNTKYMSNCQQKYVGMTSKQYEK